MNKITALLKNPRLFIPVVILALLGGLAFTLMQKTQAPDVTFVTLEGKNIRMTDLRGKVVLVNFWATDCPGCIAEMPHLVKTYNQYHDKGFEIVAVAMAYDPPNQVLNYSKKNALPFPVMHDSYEEMAKKFGNVQLTPTSFIVDKQGNVLRKVIGEMNFNDLHQLLDEKLQSNQGTTS